jgi:Tfp pilus assembly protein PilN
VLIEINLAPGAAAGRLRPAWLPTISLPNISAGAPDLRMAGQSAAVILLLGALGYGYWHLDRRLTAISTEIETAVADSTRYAGTIALIQSLQARQDTITQKISVIRSVDTRRYVWPHLLDEISLAVPAFVWLTEIQTTAAADSLQVGPSFTVQGNAGSTQALTRFMKNLEASPFVSEVTLITTAQEEFEGRIIQRFSLEAKYSEPPESEIVTIPIVALE